MCNVVLISGTEENVELSTAIGQMYSLPSYVCWKIQGNSIKDVDDRQKKKKKKYCKDDALKSCSSRSDSSQLALKLLIAVKQ